MSVRTTILGFAWILCVSACGASATSMDGGGTSEDGASAPSPFAMQVDDGAALYGAHCARCHGPSGEGTVNGPRVVGLDMGALPLEPRAGSARTTRFTTVADVAAFAAVAMPGDAPGTLTDDEYYAILAFDLSANGITLDERLTPALAATLTIPR